MIYKDGKELIPFNIFKKVIYNKENNIAVFDKDKQKAPTKERGLISKCEKMIIISSNR